MTNGDRFRKLSDEELAEKLSTQTFWNCPPRDSGCPGGCRKCWLDWLKQEVQENG